MASTSAPIHELSTAHVVALEVSPIVTAKFEHDLLNFVHKLLALNVIVLTVVQPSLRRKSNKSLWVHKWNQLPHVPFKFYQTCSCKTGNQVLGCHLTYYVGCSRSIDTYACSHVPTLSTSQQAGVVSLGASFKHLCSLLFVDYGSTAPEHVLPVIRTPTSACTSPPAEPSGKAGAQQTPDSAVHYRDSAEHCRDSAVHCLGGSRSTETQASRSITQAEHRLGGSRLTEAQAVYPTD